MLAPMRRVPSLLSLVLAGACGGSAPPLPEPTFISTRDEVSVCAAWSAGHDEPAGPAWTAGASPCDPGALTQAARDATLARIDLFRDLVGLPGVTEDEGARADAQACAVMMSVNDALDHDPPASWDCYAEGGRDAAASSNLALGTSSPADAIDLFMRDDGVDSLGHRRWVVNFDLGVVSLGFAGTATCLGVFDESADGGVDWVAYPPPGPAPIETASGTWSFHARGSLRGADVTVHRLSDERALDVRTRLLPSGYGAETIAIELEGASPVAGETYRVGVTIGTEAIVYDVHVVDCEG